MGVVDFRVRPPPAGTAAVAVLAAAAALALSILFLGPAGALRDIPYSTSVYDRNGNLLRLTLASDEKYRLKAESGRLPARFAEVLLLKEDRAFYLHPGINPAALARAFWHSLVLKDFRSGGSTVTMQLARLLYKLDTGQPAGKAGQIVRALALELAYPKGRLLAAYCSLVPCGGNVEGFPAASLLYLGKPLEALSLPETMLLCSLPQQPNERSRNPAAALQARDGLYRQWLERHPQDRALAVQFDLPQELRPLSPFTAPHAVNSLLARYPGEGLIVSTLDLRLQRAVERILTGYRDKKARFGISNACALLVRAKGMEILAEVGSADFFEEGIDGQVNGTEAKRSPGSALKPFLYALAMEQSLIHPLTVLKDAPLHFSGYNPDNFDDDFVGPIRAQDALILSRNVPAVFLSQKVKNPDLHDFLRLAGVRGLRDKATYGVSLVLGTAELSMKELAALYGILANGGSLVALADRLGGRARPAPPALLSPEAAFLTTDILARKPRPDEIGGGGPVAWKTGTSIGFRDAWSIGLFDAFILCVWVGNFDGSGNPEFIGLRSAAPLMFEIIDALRASGLEADYLADPRPRAPAGLIQARVCSVSGKIPGRFCPAAVPTLFIPGKSPIEACDVHQPVYVDLRTGLRRAQPVEGATRTEVFELWSSDLLSLFEKAGLPRRLPPPYAPGQDLGWRSESGQEPEIVSPLPGGQYAVAVREESREEIPLLAVVPADSTTLYWFLNESYLGKSGPGLAYFWKPVPGSFVLRVTDEHGRSASCRFTIGLRS